MYTETLGRPEVCECYFYVCECSKQIKHLQDCLVFIDHCVFLENVAQLVLFAFLILGYVYFYFLIYHCEGFFKLKHQFLVKQISSVEVVNTIQQNQEKNPLQFESAINKTPVNTN